MGPFIAIEAREKKSFGIPVDSLREEPLLDVEEDPVHKLKKLSLT
jgi:hypothetical protein